MSCSLLVLHPSCLILGARDKTGDMHVFYAVLVGIHWDCAGWNAMSWPASLILTLLTEGSKTDEHLCRSGVEQGKEDNYDGMVDTKLFI